MFTFCCALARSSDQPKPIDPANIDASVSPGDDFYRYANGKWLAQHPVPADESRFGAFEEVIERNRAILHELLEDAAKQTGAPKGSPAQLVGDLYASAMDEARAEADGAKPLDGEMKRIAAIASVNDLQDEIAHLQAMHVGVPFSLHAAQDEKQSTEVIVNLEQSGLGLPDRDYYTQGDEQSKKVREQYSAHVAKMFELLGDDADAAKRASAVVLKMETQLAQASFTRVQRRDPEANYHKLTLDELAALTPDVSWLRLYEGMGIADKRAVNVGQPGFLKQVDAMIKSTPLDDWKIYLRWHLLESCSGLLSSAFVNEDFAFNSKTMTGATELKTRWKRALMLVDRSLPDAVGQLYVAKNFTPQAKARAQQLVANVRAELRERLQALDWMGAATKTQALRKLDAINVKIGYPDKWRDTTGLVIDRGPTVLNVLRIRQFEFKRNIKKLGQPVDRGEWHMSAPTVNAYYNQNLNEIVFPAGILQPPFFDANADDAVNYGGIGAVIGHEITHGFDDKGRKSDADGNLKDWWTPDDEKNYSERAAVVQKQFDGFVAVDDLHVNGALTLGENIADLGGVAISYGALQKALAGKPREKIDGFTPEQRFFLSYAQIWRFNIRPQALRLRIRTDPHSPGNFRCNAPLSNLPEFMQAFNIKEGAPMMRAAGERVRIW
ncbi:MAG TPA: M13 family metallopeptidase [Planctomycetota bacterium]|nr:M13 family metallopeptidase [Planctomycetota bacterium]